MNDGIPLVELILLVAVAAFFILKLRSVLGKRTGNDKRPDFDPFNQRRENDEDKVVPLPQRGKRTATDTDSETSDHREDDEDFEGEREKPAGEGAVAAALTQIKLADQDFDDQEFLSGASAAFEMIISAFAANDRSALKPLLAKEVFENFSDAIGEREKRNETLETTLVGITEATIIEALLEQKTAFVVVKFISEQVNVTRDAAGEVVDGDPSYVARITDLWTFARNPRSRDPNWSLAATDTPN